MRKIDNKKQPRTPDSRRTERGYGLVEIMLGMLIVLILVGGVAYSANRLARSARESTATGNVNVLADHENTFYHEWQGYSPLAVNMKGSELSGTTQAIFAADEELPTSEASLLDAGYVNGGYTILYKAGPITFVDSAGNTVSTSFEFTGIPQNISDTKAVCADPSGTWFNTLGTAAIPASGGGCAADGYASH